MKFTNRLKARPIHLLLYLEWILFLISIVGQFRTRHLPLPPVKSLPFFPPINSDVSPLSFIFVVALILLGLVQPDDKPTENIIYIGLGFLLIGLTWITGETQVPLVLPLLLIMVIRGCLTFKLFGSFVVASICITWFLISLYLAVKNSFNNLDVQQIPSIVAPGIEPEILYQLFSTNEEQLKALTINMAINITILFCLINVFVFILVNALMSEYRSRQELKLVNQQLREYALLIEDRAMLQERNRIAREIHDSLGHSLTALNIQLANALLYLHSNLGRSETFLTEAKKMGSDALKEVRQSVSTLRSDPLQGKLLHVAVLDLIKDLKYRTEIIVNYQNEITQRLPKEMTNTVYRIVQEALTNITKHSGATEVSVSLKLVAGELQVRIQDNGMGFEPQENTTGFGIRGMYERAKALGGKLNLISMPRKGCQIAATIPLLNNQL